MINALFDRKCACFCVLYPKSSMSLGSLGQRDTSRDDPFAEIEWRRELRKLRREAGPKVLFIGCENEEARRICPVTPRVSDEDRTPPLGGGIAGLADYSGFGFSLF
jgi:hypothetical protein